MLAVGSHRVVCGLLLAALAVMTGCGGGHPAAGTGAEGDAGWRVQALKGQAIIVRDGKQTVVTPAHASALRAGDHVQTEAGAEAVLILGDQVHLLGSATELSLDAGGSPVSPGGSVAGPESVNLIAGLVNFFIPARADPRKFRATTDTVVASVKGTVFTLEIAGDEVRVTVVSGRVDVAARTAGSPSSGETVLTANRRARIADGKVTDEALPDDQVRRLKSDLFLKKERLKIDLAQF
jgi:hypothetical protein